MLAAAGLFALLQRGSPAVSPIAKIDSREQGRTFYVDTDKPHTFIRLTDHYTLPRP